MRTTIRQFIDMMGGPKRVADADGMTAEIWLDRECEVRFATHAYDDPQHRGLMQTHCCGQAFVIFDFNLHAFSNIRPAYLVHDNVSARSGKRDMLRLVFSA